MDAIFDANSSTRLKLIFANGQEKITTIGEMKDSDYNFQDYELA